MTQGGDVGLMIHVDGGARGNPGPAGAGVVIRDDSGRLLYEAGYYLGRQTNNAAEYHALLRALERAAQIGSRPITIHSDSELLVRQLTGEYQVKSAKLAPLYQQVQMLLVKTSPWTVRHVPREENERADALANLAMDQREDVIVFDTEPPGDVARPRPSRPPRSKAQPRVAPRAGEAAAAPDGARPAIQVTCACPAKAGICPAGDGTPQVFTISSTLPAGLCVYAAHALLPTLLGMLNTDPEEFAAVPTLSVRCTRAGCSAEFKLSPVRSPNGAGRRPKPRP